MKGVNAIPEHVETVSNEILDLKIFKLVRGDHDNNDECSDQSS